VVSQSTLLELDMKSASPAKLSLLKFLVETGERACLKKLAEPIPIGHALGYNSANDSEVMPDAVAPV